jgi:hypothetical protein
MFDYALNNPASNIDPSGFDCIFFSDDSKPQSSIRAGYGETDDVNPKQCADDGGDWVNGEVDLTNYTFDPTTGSYTFNSSDSRYDYVTR